MGMRADSGGFLPEHWREQLRQTPEAFPGLHGASHRTVMSRLPLTLIRLSLVALASDLQPIYSSSCSQQPGSRLGMLSACTTGTDGASGAACTVCAALRSSLLADVAPSHACADSLMYLESSVAVRRRRSRSSCPAGPGMRQAHHLRRMPMGGIGGIFNLYFILKTLKLLIVTNGPYRY